MKACMLCTVCQWLSVHASSMRVLISSCWQSNFSILVDDLHPGGSVMSHNHCHNPKKLSIAWVVATQEQSL
eukprot:6009687-Amphidinium_carterae.1